VSKFTRLAVGTSAVMLGLVPPLAHAAVPPTNLSVCSSSSDPGNPLGGAGDGLILAGGAAGLDITCAFTTTGDRSLTYVVQSGNAWEITVNDVVATAQPVTFPSGLWNGTLAVGAGSTVRITVHPTCDPSGATCGSQATASVGQDALGI
jgi:hypothetical protein